MAKGILREIERSNKASIRASDKRLREYARQEKQAERERVRLEKEKVRQEKEDERFRKAEAKYQQKELAEKIKLDLEYEKMAFMERSEMRTELRLGYFK
ncbi:MAG: hypothetical protein OCD00_15095 [Colwellia sp.]